MNGTGLTHSAAPLRAAIESVPAEWRWCRIKQVAVLNAASLPEDSDPDRLIEYIDISAVDGLGRIKSVEEMRFSSAPSRARRLVTDGDSIVSTVRTYLKAIAFIDETVAHCVVSTGFMTLSPNQEALESRYLYWWLRSSPFIDEIVARSVGVSYPAVPASDVGSIGIPIPPLGEQGHIVAVLDEETAHIDALMREQERMLGPCSASGAAGLLGERRQALITAVMTGGLDALKGVA